MSAVTAKDVAVFVDVSDLGSFAPVPRLLSVEFSGGAAERIESTYAHSTSREYLAGMADTPELQVRLQYDPADDFTEALRTAVGTSLAFRCDWWQTPTVRWSFRVNVLGFDVDAGDGSQPVAAVMRGKLDGVVARAFTGLPNGSFVQGLDGWTANNAGAAALGEGWDGPHAVRLDPPDGYSFTEFESDAGLAVQAGETVRLAVAAKGSDAASQCGAWIGVRWRDDGGAALSTDKVDLWAPGSFPGTDWAATLVELEAPPSAVAAHAVLEARANGNPGGVDFDAVDLSNLGSI